MHWRSSSLSDTTHSMCGLRLPIPISRALIPRTHTQTALCFPGFGCYRLLHGLQAVLTLPPVLPAFVQRLLTLLLPLLCAPERLLQHTSQSSQCPGPRGQLRPHILLPLPASTMQSCTQRAANEHLTTSVERGESCLSSLRGPSLRRVLTPVPNYPPNTQEATFRKTRSQLHNCRYTVALHSAKWVNGYNDRKNKDGTLHNCQGHEKQGKPGKLLQTGGD